MVSFLRIIPKYDFATVGFGFFLFFLILEDLVEQNWLYLYQNASN